MLQGHFRQLFRLSAVIIFCDTYKELLLQIMLTVLHGPEYMVYDATSIPSNTNSSTDFTNSASPEVSTSPLLFHPDHIFFAGQLLFDLPVSNGREYDTGRHGIEIKTWFDVPSSSTNTFDANAGTSVPSFGTQVYTRYENGASAEIFWSFVAHIFISCCAAGIILKIGWSITPK